MPKVNIINYEIKDSTQAYLFVSAIGSKSTINGNITIFENFNINELIL